MRETTRCNPGPVTRKDCRWFVALLPIKVAPGVAHISDGWKQFGTVTLISHSRFAYHALWNSVWQMIAALAAAGLVGGGTPAGVARVQPRQGVVGGFVGGGGTRRAAHPAGGGPGGSVELHLRIQQRPTAQAQRLGPVPVQRRLSGHWRQRRQQAWAAGQRILATAAKCRTTAQ